MSEIIKRADGRLPYNLRPIKITYNVFDYAAGSILYEIGRTKVLCAVTMQPGVPPFLRGTKTGWLNAEYSLMPTSTPTRVARESVTGKRSGRTVEISRLIGRVLRTIVKLDTIGERTITIDCDVLQADGGTRTACITGACLALRAAIEMWISDGTITEQLLTDDVAAISVGIVDRNVVLDVDFAEDSSGDADMNFVMTRSGSVIEVQASSEKKPMSWHQFEQARELAVRGIEEIFNISQLGPISNRSDTEFPARTGNPEHKDNLRGFPLFTRVTTPK